MKHLFFFLFAVGIVAPSEALSEGPPPVRPFLLNLPRYEEFSQLTLPQRAFIVEQLRGALIKIERESAPEFYSNSFKFIDVLKGFTFSLIPEACAQNSAPCIFAGYIQNLNARGKCPLINKCDNGQARCNPALFGDDTCIDKSPENGWREATALCEEAAKLTPLDVAKVLERDPKAQTTWDSMQENLLQYCQSHRQSDKTACEVIRERLNGIASQIDILKEHVKIMHNINKEVTNRQPIACKNFLLPQPRNQEESIAVTNLDLDQNEQCFKLPKDESTADTEKQIAKTTENLLSCLTGKKDAKSIAWAIHRWIIENVDYDYVSLNDGTYKTKNTAGGVFESGLGVCGGYTELFLSMAKSAGLKAEKVLGHVDLGKTEPDWSTREVDPNLKCQKKDDRFWCPHAWQKIQLEDGSFLQIDTTWSDPGAVNVFLPSCIIRSSSGCSGVGYMDPTLPSYSPLTPQEKAKFKNYMRDYEASIKKAYSDYFGNDGRYGSNTWTTRSTNWQ